MCTANDTTPCLCEPAMPLDPFVLPVRIRNHIAVQVGESVRIQYLADAVVLSKTPSERPE